MANTISIENVLEGGEVGVKHANSLILQRVPVEDFSQIFDYGLHDINNLADFK